MDLLKTLKDLGHLNIPKDDLAFWKSVGQFLDAPDTDSIPVGTIVGKIFPEMDAESKKQIDARGNIKIDDEKHFVNSGGEIRLPIAFPLGNTPIEIPTGLEACIGTKIEGKFEREKSRVIIHFWPELSIEIRKGLDFVEIKTINIYNNRIVIENPDFKVRVALYDPANFNP